MRENIRRISENVLDWKKNAEVFLFTVLIINYKIEPEKLGVFYVL